MAALRSALVPLVVIVVVLGCAAAASAASYTVGDDKGWTTGVNYTEWTSGKTFAVGDELVFNFENGKHDVVKVGAVTCSTSNAMWTFNQSSVSTTIPNTGSHYCICGFPNHCSSGMKLAVVVKPGTPPANGASARRPRRHRRRRPRQARPVLITDACACMSRGQGRGSAVFLS